MHVILDPLFLLLYSILRRAIVKNYFSSGMYQVLKLKLNQSANGPWPQGHDIVFIRERKRQRKDNAQFRSTWLKT